MLWQTLEIKACDVIQKGEYLNFARRNLTSRNQSSGSD